MGVETRAYLWVLFSLPSLLYGQLHLPANLRFVAEFKYPLTNSRSTRVYQLQSPPEEINNFERTKYVHDPVFLPSATCDEKNRLLCCFKRPHDEKYRCEMVILLTSPLIREYAYRATKECIDGFCRSLDLKDISLRSISGVKIESSISDYFQYAQLEKTYIPVVPGQEEIFLKFILPSIDHVSKFEHDIQFADIEYQCFFGDLNIAINSYSIKWDHFLSTSLYAALDGVASATSISEGERIAYIHRDDLKDLLLESLQNLRQNNWIQNEARFVEQIENIFIRMFPLVDSLATEFTKEMWTHTYNAHDLAPDRVTQYVYQKYDESSSQSSSSTSGGLSEIGFSFSDSDAQSFQERHEFTLTKQGEMWVPKGAKVRRINLSRFSSTQTFTRVDTFVLPTGNTEQGIISIRRSLSSQTFSYGSEKENQLMMISSLLQSKKLALLWYGKKETIPEGWKLCDGTDDSPDFRGRVPRGSQSDEFLKNIGGADSVRLSVNQMPPHDHCEGDYCSVNRQPTRHGWEASYARTSSAREFEDRRRMRTVGEAAPIDIRPSFVAVYYICLSN